jgi:hypothetical protein
LNLLYLKVSSISKNDFDEGEQCLFHARLSQKELDFLSSDEFWDFLMSELEKAGIAVSSIEFINDPENIQENNQENLDY